MDVDSIGYVAAVLTTMSFFPQAIKTLRTDDTRSISLSMYFLFTIGVAIWAVFGLLSGNGPVILANGFTLIPASFVLQKKIRHRLLGGEH
ncbi:PQ loop repeat family protein [Synechococcus sp. BIOS-E4-1]|uniref:SemiSWEET transporter n=1 Tax=Synechococcus sp. BIOS-E4-1 TaxID=1400864 RepID=UPI0016468113|nr:SemiSWEET transporter [Synechococcus sp. BIOS-E4-1]QNI55480.1 PQ loop repeat family protein [Synechococcus sp. BIOS-E4-1]